MRIRLEFDALLGLNGPQRAMIAVPPGLSLVGDLLHYLHRNFALPLRPMTLRLDGFSLLPGQRIWDILRDGEVLEVLPVFERHPSAKRRRLALLAGPSFSVDVFGGVSCRRSNVGRTFVADPTTASTLPIALEWGRRSPALLAHQALPAAAETASAVGMECPSRPTVVTDPAATGADRVVAVATGVVTANAAATRKRSRPPALLALPTQPGPADVATAVPLHRPPVVPAAETLPAAAAADGGARAFLDFAKATRSRTMSIDDASALPLPDPDEPGVWKPIARDPSPGELLRFRVAGCTVGTPGGISAPRVALCLAVEEDCADAGLVCVLRGRHREENERLPMITLLQVSIYRPRVNSTASMVQTCAAREQLLQPKVVGDAKAVGAEEVDAAVEASVQPELCLGTELACASPTEKSQLACKIDSTATVEAEADTGPHTGVGSGVGIDSQLSVGTALSSWPLDDLEPRKRGIPAGAVGKSTASSVASSSRAGEMDDRLRSGAFQTVIASPVDSCSGSIAAVGSTSERIVLQEQTAKFTAPRGVDPAEFGRQKLEKLRQALCRQVDYYFGDANYRKDKFLRSQADAEGWTSLRLVAKFNRVKDLTSNLEFIREVWRTSGVVEISDCGLYLRRRALVAQDVWSS